MTPFTGKSCIASLLNEISFSLQTKTANKFVFACTTLLPYRGPDNSLFQTLCSPGGKKHWREDSYRRELCLVTGLVIDHWTEDRRKTYMSRASLYDLGTKPGTTKRANETKWRSAEKLSHPVVTYVVTQYSLFVYAIWTVSILSLYCYILRSVTSVNLKKAGMASRNIVIKKQYTLLWISFAVVFGLLVFGCLYRDQSPILERRGRLYTGNFNPISSSFIQKCSQKYSLCLLRRGIKLRELTKRNFALRRGILRVKRLLKLSSARSLSPIGSCLSGLPPPWEAGKRSENWSWPFAEMVSVIREFKQGFVTFFRQTKASAKPARSARHAGRGKVFYSPVTRVWRVPLACSLPRRHSYGSVTRSCGAGKRDKPPGTSPREANSRVTSDDCCSTNERVPWEGFDCINWRNLRFNFYLFDDVCCSHSPLISIISWNISCSVMQEVLKVFL